MGAFMAKSSLRATPFLMSKVAVSSLKSVFLDLSALASLVLNTFTLFLISRMLPAISTPLIAPSAKLSAALPAKAFLSAPTVLPCVVTSILTVPVPDNMSLLMASTNNGPIETLFMFCLNAILGVLRASTLRLPFMLPLYKLAENGDNVATPSFTFRPKTTFSVLTLASLSQPILASPVAFNFFSALKSMGVSVELLAVVLVLFDLVMYLSASKRSMFTSKLNAGLLNWVIPTLALI